MTRTLFDKQELADWRIIYQNLEGEYDCIWGDGSSVEFIAPEPLQLVSIRSSRYRVLKELRIGNYMQLVVPVPLELGRKLPPTNVASTGMRIVVVFDV